MTASVTMLLWGVYENVDEYKDSGQLEYLLDNVKWVIDYFIKCKSQVGQDEFIVQLSDNPNDHIDIWVSSEIVEKRVADKGYERKAYLADLDHPASTPIAEVAASLAISSIIFNDESKSGSFYDPAYAADCLETAEELLALVKQMNEDSGYHDIPNVPDTYKSWSGFYDEYQWASV